MIAAPAQNLGVDDQITASEDGLDVFRIGRGRRCLAPVNGLLQNQHQGHHDQQQEQSHTEPEIAPQQHAGQGDHARGQRGLAQDHAHRGPRDGSAAPHAAVARGGHDRELRQQALAASRNRKNAISSIAPVSRPAANTHPATRMTRLAVTATRSVRRSMAPPSQNNNVPLVSVAMP